MPGPGIRATIGARVSSDSTVHLGRGGFGASGSPRPGHTLDEIEAAIEAEIEKLLADGVTETEVRTAIERMQAEAIFARDSLGGPPRILGNALMTGQTLADVEAWPDRIGQVTKADIKAAARAVLNGSGAVTTRLSQKLEEKS